MRSLYNPAEKAGFVAVTKKFCRTNIYHTHPYLILFILTAESLGTHILPRTRDTMRENLFRPCCKYWRQVKHTPQTAGRALPNTPKHIGTHMPTSSTHIKCRGYSLLSPRYYTQILKTYQILTHIWRYLRHVGRNSRSQVAAPHLQCSSTASSCRTDHSSSKPSNSPVSYKSSNHRHFRTPPSSPAGTSGEDRHQTTHANAVPKVQAPVCLAENHGLPPTFDQPRPCNKS